jgi:predicted DNA-binding transcriptional regulator AlpA
MAKRLINLKQIRAEKISRGRSWIFSEMSAGRFPKPAVYGTGSGGHLWDEAAIDAWLERFIADAKRSAADAESATRSKAKKASSGRAEQRLPA